MFCNNCGAQNPDGANNCSNCGASLNNTQQTSQPAAPVQNNAPVQPVTPAQPQKPKNNKGLIIGIVAGVVALIAIVAVVLVFVLGGDKDKDDEKDGSSTTKAAVTQDAGDKDKDNKDNNSDDKPANKPATSNMSYQDVVKEFFKLCVSGDFNGALKYSAIDLESYLTDAANSNGISISDVYNILEEATYDETGEEIEITSIDQFYTIMGKMYSEDIGSYTVTEVKITGADLLDVTDSYDMDDIKEEYVDCYAFWGLGFDENDLSKYVDTSKITEAYDVDADVTITYSDGTSETVSAWCYVVNYNGNWLVIGEPLQLCLS